MTDLNGKTLQSFKFNNTQILNLTLEEPAGLCILIIESMEKDLLLDW